MSSITASNTAQAVFEAEEERRWPGLVRRAAAAIIEWRCLAAEHRIAAYLEGLSDARLADLGFSAADVSSIRAGASIRDCMAGRALTFKCEPRTLTSGKEI